MVRAALTDHPGTGSDRDLPADSVPEDPGEASGHPAPDDDAPPNRADREAAQSPVAAPRALPESADQPGNASDGLAEAGTRTDVVTQTDVKPVSRPGPGPESGPVPEPGPWQARRGDDFRLSAAEIRLAPKTATPQVPVSSRAPGSVSVQISGGQAPGMPVSEGRGSEGQAFARSLPSDTDIRAPAQLDAAQPPSHVAGPSTGPMVFPPGELAQNMASADERGIWLARTSGVTASHRSPGSVRLASDVPEPALQRADAAGKAISSDVDMRGPQAEPTGEVGRMRTTPADQLPIEKAQVSVSYAGRAKGPLPGDHRSSGAFSQAQAIGVHRPSERVIDDGPLTGGPGPQGTKSSIDPGSEPATKVGPVTDPNRVSQARVEGFVTPDLQRVSPRFALKPDAIPMAARVASPDTGAGAVPRVTASEANVVSRGAGSAQDVPLNAVRDESLTRTVAASTSTGEVQTGPGGSVVGPSELFGTLGDPVVTQMVSANSGDPEVARGLAGQIGVQIGSQMGLQPNSNAGAQTGGSNALPVGPEARGLAGAEREFVLSPPELGRLGIRFEGTPDSGLLVLQADRPETLDLMRRHIDILTESLRQAGLGGCGVSLGGRDSGHRPPETAGQPLRAPSDSMPEVAARAFPPYPPAGDSGRLDLRL